MTDISRRDALKAGIVASLAVTLDKYRIFPSSPQATLIQKPIPVSGEKIPVIGMGTALNLDPTLRSVADLPPGWTASRARVGDAWVRRADPDV